MECLWLSVTGWKRAYLMHWAWNGTDQRACSGMKICGFSRASSDDPYGRISWCKTSNDTAERLYEFACVSLALHFLWMISRRISSHIWTVSHLKRCRLMLRSRVCYVDSLEFNILEKKSAACIIKKNLILSQHLIYFKIFKPNFNMLHK